MRYIIQLLLLGTLGIGQVSFPAGNPIPQSLSGVSIPSKLQFQHRVSFVASSSEFGSQSIGVYSNFAHYKFSENFSVRTGIHLKTPIMNSMNKFENKPAIDFEFDLNYKFSNNFYFNLYYSRANSMVQRNSLDNFHRF